MLEFIFELLFEFILEGSIMLGSEKTVPMPFRILATFVILVVYFGLGGFLVYSACTGTDDGNLFVGAVGLFIIIGGFFMIYKMFKKKKEKEMNLWD